MKITKYIHLVEIYDDKHTETPKIPQLADVSRFCNLVHIEADSHKNHKRPKI